MSIIEKPVQAKPRLPEHAKLWAEPVLLLDAQGEVLDANGRARSLFGSDVQGGLLEELVADPQAIKALLRSATGVGEPVLGGLVLRRPQAGHARRRVYALALREPSLTFVLRFPETDSNFETLTRRLGLLHREIAERRAAQARLELALNENQLLLSELQHRVKNHLQIVLGLMTAALHDSESEERKQFIEGVRAKLAAVLEAQQLMYRSAAAPSLSGAELIERIAAQFATHPDVEVGVNAAHVELSHDHAFPLALILNELFSNALKYGRSEDGRVRIRVDLTESPAGFLLRFADCGPGCDPSPVKQRRGSGFGLVKGLCRQLGAEFVRDNEGGCVATLRFGGR